MFYNASKKLNQLNASSYFYFGVIHAVIAVQCKSKKKKKCNLEKNDNFVVVYAFAISPYVNSVTSFYCLEIEQILESIDKRKFAIAQFIVVFPLQQSATLTSCVLLHTQTTASAEIIQTRWYHLEIQTLIK